MTNISVAMATFNGEPFLHEQLTSLTHQTKRPFELVITDDGSTDGTLNIIAEFAKTAPFPVRVYRNEQRLGYKANFLKCANLCSGELIAFADQDDVWMNEKLEKQARQFACPDVLVSCHKVVLMSQNGVDRGEARNMLNCTGKFTYAEMFPFAYNFGFTQVMRRSLLDLDDHWAHSSNPLAHDEYFFFLASVLGQIHYDETVLARYRQHDSNVSGKKKRKSFIEVIFDRFALRASDYELFVRNAVERLRILNSISSDPKLPASLNRRVREAANAYLQLSERHKRRLALYGGRTNVQRGIAVFNMLVSGDYEFRPNPWHFTVAGFIKDIGAVLLPISAKRCHSD